MWRMTWQIDDLPTPNYYNTRRAMIWKWNDNEKWHIKTKQCHRKHYKKEQLRDLCFSHFYIIKYGKMLFRKVIRTFRVHHCKVSVFNLNTRTAEGASSGWILARLTVKISDHLKTLPGRLILNGDMGTINVWSPTVLYLGKREPLDNEQKVVMQYHITASLPGAYSIAIMRALSSRKFS